MTTLESIIKESDFVDYIEINLEKSNNLLPWESKVGGMPYIPKGKSWPLNNDNSTILDSSSILKKTFRFFGYISLNFA